MSTAYWRHYSHPADMGIRACAPTRQQAFEQAALALTAIITDPGKVEPNEQIRILCEEDTDEMLFVSWLNAIIYEIATRSMLFSSFEVKIEDYRLDAKISGEKIDPARHNPAVEIKAATFMDLQVRQTPDGNWFVQCIIDI